MSDIFLSASIPSSDDGYPSCCEIEIKKAIHKIVLTAKCESARIVLGGHPSVIKMLADACETNLFCFDNVIIYQSLHFGPERNMSDERLSHVIWTDDTGDLASSLIEMRAEMLSQCDISSAYFIGGGRGMIDEYVMLTERTHAVPICVLCRAGGAAVHLSKMIDYDRWCPSQIASTV